MLINWIQDSPTMGISSETEMEHKREVGSIVQQFLYRLPKKNHEAMIQLEKQFADAFRRNGGLGYEVFQLNGTENMMEGQIWRKLCRPTRMRRFGLSKCTTEIVSSEMNSWQCVE
jgi:hypothetical protein